jgi:phosphohistidine phosphatase
MKRLYLMRHAHAVNGHPMDSARGLTDKGKKQAREMGDWLVKQIGRVDILITSPFKRAQQTTAIVAPLLGTHVADTRLAEPDAMPFDYWKEVERLAQQSKDVLIIGHDPSINILLKWLIGFPRKESLFDPPASDYQPYDESGLKFKHGAVAHLVIDGDGGAGSGELHWLVTAGCVERDEQEQEVIEAARELAAHLL